MSMTRTKLGEVVDFTNGGAWNQSEYVDSGIPVVRVSDIHDETIQLDECKHLAFSSQNKYQKHLLHTGDVVVATVGSHPTQPGSVVGRAARVPASANGSLLNQNAVCIRPLNGAIDTSYLRYVAVSQYFRNYIIAHARGSANQVRMAISLLREMPLCLPSRERQREIGGILSAYDDLIEKNIRRIKILEQMARMLYREWFVNFRFPGHQKVKLIDSEVGPIPSGWERRSLSDIAEFIGRGISPTYDDEAEGLVINQKCIRDGQLNLVQARRQSKIVPEQKLVQNGDILINSTGVGTLGRVAQVLEPISNCTVDSHVSIVRPKDSPEFFGKALLELENHFATQGVGSTGQTELSRDRIGSTQIVIPPSDLLAYFCRAIAPMNNLIVCCLKRNGNLRQTRDLLLPKLVSGEVNIEQVEAKAVAQAV